MAWRMVVQPNSLYARFADPVDNFTHLNMTREQAYEYCRELMGRDEAEQKVRRAELEPERWAEALETITAIHGAEESARIEERAREAEG